MTDSLGAPRAPEEPEPRARRFGVGRWRFVGRWWHQWREIFGHDYNWRNFTFVTATAEWSTADAVYKGRYLEITVGLFGVLVEMELYDYVDRAEALSPVERRAQDWEERHGEA